ncbi:MAG: hypothetical protein AB1813_16060 [Verrucomicrobiota bacterium]
MKNRASVHAVLLTVAIGLGSGNLSFAQADFTLENAGVRSAVESAAGDYTLRALIGEPFTDESVGGSFSLKGGFVPDMIVRTEEEPLLQIAQLQNSIQISWPAHYAGFVVETSTDLLHWSRLESNSVISGDQRVLTLSLQEDRLFFRLRK